MVLKHILGFILVAATLVSPMHMASSTKLDPGPKPIAIVPNHDTISSGQSVTFTITMDQTVTSNTTVTLTSSNQSVLPMPGSAMVQSGNSQVAVTSLPDFLKSAKGKSTVVRVTVSNSEGSTYTDVTVN
jgi:hypothetical protein